MSYWFVSGYFCLLSAAEVVDGRDDEKGCSVSVVCHKIFVSDKVS